jgi:high-affinity iron transporter
MLATAVILFREILEAALIIGIVAAATRGISYRGWWISSGVICGILGAALVAAVADVLVEMADGMGQELFNAIILLAAVAMLGWHNIWMASHSRELVAQMKQVGGEVKEGGKTMFALLLVVALAVLREGSEVVLFLYGQSAQGLGLAGMISGGFIGLVAGAGVGLAMYLGLLRIPTRYLFSVTSWMILLLAAGMASQAAKFLVQADKLPAWSTLWDTSFMLSNESVTGRLLHTLVGYDAAPMGVQMAVYLLTIGLIGGAMQMVKKRDAVQQQSRADVVKTAMAVMLLPLALITGSRAHAGPASYVYMPNVEYGETELELSGGLLRDDDQTIDDAQSWKLGLGHGVTPWWMTEVEFRWDKEPSAAARYSLAEWVNIFQLTERGQYWMDVSLFTEFELQNHRSNGADAFEFGPMFQKEVAGTQTNLNLVFVSEYGSEADSPIKLEYAWQIKTLNPGVLQYGAQGMGAFGRVSNFDSYDNQEHQFGPALFGEIKSGQQKVKFNTALLFGVTDNTPDQTLRFSVEYEVR